MIYNFRFFCQKVLPLVYDDSLSFMELLYKVINKINEVINSTNGFEEAIEKVDQEIADLKIYVDDYFENLDLADEISEKIEEMYEDGRLAELVDFSLKEEFTKYFAPRSYLNNQVDKLLFLNDDTIISQGGAMQGCCFDSTRNHIIIAFSSQDTRGVIAIYDTDFNLIRTTVLNIDSHYNDMAYDPVNDVIYFPARPTQDKLFKISPTTGEVLEEIVLDFGGIIKRISFDTETNRFYVGGDSYIKIYDSDFNFIKTISLTFSTIAAACNVNVNYMTRQSSLMIDGAYSEMFFISNPSVSANMPEIYIFSISDQGRIYKVYNIDSVVGYDECQGLYNIGSDYYITTARGRINYIIKFQTEVFKSELNYKRYEPIPQGADMDDYKLPGSYVAINAATVNSLSNCPFNNQPFTLHVLPVDTGSYTLQVFLTRNGRQYLRYYNHGTSTWTTKGRVEAVKEYTPTSSTWVHRLFDDGYCEAFYNFEYTGGITTQTSGALYRSDLISIDLPSVNGTLYKYAISGTARNGCWIIDPFIENNKLNFYLYGNTSTTASTTVRLIMHAHYNNIS